MKTRILISFVIVTVVSACASAPQVTVTPQATVTLPPTSTPEPTFTPEPQLPEELQAKFDQAGVDLGKLENATVDKSGLHITIDGKTTDINTQTLQTSTFNSIRDNSIRIIDTANKDGVFVMTQTEGGKWAVEKQEFTPTKTIEFSEALSDLEPKLSKKAKPEAIYWDVAVSKLMDTQSINEGMEFNRTIYQEMVDDNSDWEGITNDSKPEKKLAFIQEFLRRSGGLMIVRDAKWQKLEANFNNPPRFTIEEVSKITNEYPSVYNSIGFKQHVGGNGELTFSILTLKGELNRLAETKGTLLQNVTANELISLLFWHMVSGSVLGGERITNTTDHKLYTNTNPGNQNYYSDLSWGFIE